MTETDTIEFLEMNNQKRRKTNTTEQTTKKPVLNKIEPKLERCLICRQYLTEVLLYNGHPNNSVEEYVALTDEKLMLFTGDESSFDDLDTRPTHKVTYFSVYDRNGHLCPFDTGLIESNKLLYFSGYIKPVYDEDSFPENGIATKDMGPINEWWISGYDGGEKGLLGFSTEYAEYYLVESSPEYEPFMKIVRQKMLLCKIVIEFLTDNFWENPTYEDLLNKLQSSGHPGMCEEVLIRHAHFVCDQVMSVDAQINDEERLLITAPCMRALVKMTGVNFQKSYKIRTTKEVRKRVRTTIWSKATTTNLVHDVFETFFSDQIDKTDYDGKNPRKKRCGVCDACQLPDCGKCTHCRGMLKFGGSGKRKQACKMRRCPNMAIQEAEENDENEDEDGSSNENAVVVKVPEMSKRIVHKVEWVGEPAFIHKDRIYYNKAKVGDIIVEPFDYVMLNSNKSSKPPYIAKITYMWQDSYKMAHFHAHFFCRGSDTILGETSDPRELFLVDICDNCPLGSIVRKANVEYRKPDKNWSKNGGLDRLPAQLEDDGKTFFYSKRYESDSSRFLDITTTKKSSTYYTSCDSCKEKLHRHTLATPTLKDDCIYWEGDVYRVGSGVYLEVDTFKFAYPMQIRQDDNSSDVDEDVYPEYYRKSSIESLKGLNGEKPQPFCIGLIEEIKKSEQKKIPLIKVRKFYRPENTHKSMLLWYQQDLNMLYWSEEEFTISFSRVKGKCYLAYGDTLNEPLSQWSQKGPNRFYFTEAYDSRNFKFFDVPIYAKKVGFTGKGTGMNKSSKNVQKNESPPIWDQIERPLRCMDVFAGCGGLSEGLHQSGVAETKWAIEKDPTAAQAFKINNPNCNVYVEDCNELLRKVMMNDEKNLPKKGDVEMLVGGPPCQGFSGMNRFSAGQYSLFKNSLIVSFLSYCDYYRPKYFILENVRNFVSFKRSIVLKLTLRCLLAMGYQVTFGILQAGHYGIPQTRRRLIVMAAAPGTPLPRYPEPLHVFHKRGCQLSFQVNGVRYTTGMKWTESAPYRMITVRDAMSDLPLIRNGHSRNEIPYNSEALTHFQRLIRGSCDVTVRDHVCKEMMPLVEARMSFIPTSSGADWRDLPNIVVRLSDGSYTVKLKYPYRMKRQSKEGKARGVCQCALGKECDPADRQFNTLIPWCLPHTGDRHNHWTGLYGRLEWDGLFGTTVTNPEPMGKQGRVLHPEQHRVVSVRECARSQGFPDRYVFYGNILDKHRQVGNAVPPPLGAALGREISKALTSINKH